MLGQVVTGMGSQAALVALPFQAYELTGSALQTGLVGLVELVPVVLASLPAGAFADRRDRRRLLELCQIALVALVAVLLPDLVRDDAAEMASLGAEPA
jgi:MFS family permease